MSEPYQPGQRWFSTAEPELGLATVMRVAGRSVQLVFTGSGVVRQYAIGSAPLIRAAFGSGDSIRVEGKELRVDRVEVDAGLITYHCAGASFPEGCLDAEQPISRADRRLLSGRVDRSDQFDLRVELLEERARARRHPGWGILGARVDLVPHQLRVTGLAARRRPPRLLLADEVGLGKTIEACMILAQQLAAGRVRRVLILVPDSLIHQWFVELLRRFNLGFAIFDPERCDAIEEGSPHRNPFEEDQRVIAGIDWLAADSRRHTQLLEAGWDLLLVDEAHHLGWESEARPSPAYRLVEALAARTPAVLLLTATPEQLGLEGHFARLRLLDPARYHDFASFQAETACYVEVSSAVQALEQARPLERAQMDALATVLGGDGAGDPMLEAALAGDTAARGALIDRLVDRHGTGRVMLRNRRESVGGFPERIAQCVTLPGPLAEEVHAQLHAEFLCDTRAGTAEPVYDYRHDPRLGWLLDVLERIAPQKLLVLCRSRARVEAIEDALRSRSGVEMTRFHEDMTLVQRDRNAAWFADPSGARVLIASEVGAEGRNFQFAQHLLLWDLPLDPDRLEQRIGRLDRIGQAGAVNIHVAAVESTAQHVLLRWYREALDAFSSVVVDARELLQRMRADLLECALTAEAGADAITALITTTRALHRTLSHDIARGRDYLLELASRRFEGDGLLQALEDEDVHATGDSFPLRLLESFGIHHEDHGQGLWRLDPEYQAIEGFEEFRHGARLACLDRSLALARDDVLYLRADHPMLMSAGDLLLSSEAGNAAFLVDELPPRTVFLEAVFVLECIALQELDVERFLPPQPVRVTVDTRLQSRADFRPSERAMRRARDRAHDLEPQRKLLGALVPPMLEACHRHANAQAQAVIAEAVAQAGALLEAEISRTRALALVNPAVTSEDVARLDSERAQIVAALPQARLRLDALRLSAGPDFLSLRR